MGKDYERICEWGNLYDAYLKARRGKRWKNSVAKVEASALEAVALIQRELQTRTYRPGGYRAFYVYEPKRRLIQTNSFKDKIVQHAFCDQVLYDALTKPFILDNYGSQVGKGTHFGLNRRKQKSLLKACNKKGISPITLTNSGVYEELPPLSELL